MTYSAQNVNRVLCDIQCPECEQLYIRQRARRLGTRIKEHMSSVFNEMKETRILDLEENWFRRKIKEATNLPEPRLRLGAPIILF